MTVSEQPGPVAAGSQVDGAAAVQRRVLRILMASQVLGAVAVSLGVTAGTVAAVDVSGSDVVGGAALTPTAVGAALTSALLARIAERGGRRPSLATGYALAAGGGIIAALGVALGWWPVLLAGLLGFGSGMATGLAARFAAADLAPPDRRGRAVGIVLWTGTLGAVAGPNLAGPAERITGSTSGVFAVAAVLYVLAALVVATALRPDPLLLARAQADLVRSPSTSAARAAEGTGKRTTRSNPGWDAIRASPTARFALAGLALLHLGMVAVMSMSPVHLHHGGADLELIGLVISAHIAGMYLFSPLFGVATDRIGSVPTLLGGAATLALGALVCASAGSHDAGPLAGGLVLIGLGWNAGLIAGSAMLVDALPAESRPRAQGLSDVTMNTAGALGGVLAGLIVAVGSFAILGIVTAGLIAAYPLLRLRTVRVP